MKKIIFKTTTVLFTLMAVFSCSTDNKVIDDVFEGVQKGAFLRTTETNSLNFNIYDQTSFFDIAIEYQDSEKGALLSEVNVYLSYTDKHDGGNSKAETLYSTLPASAFSPSEYGLPSTSLRITFGEALSAAGVSVGQTAGGDNFTVRLEAKLTDGRSYTDVDANGNIAALGGYYSSPYSYSVGVKCIPLTPVAGDYVLDLVDTYGDGWDGAFITVTIAGVSTDYTVDTTDNSYTVTVPDGTTDLVFTYTPGSFESEHEFEIIAPNGDVAAQSPGVAGEIILNICL